jgi:hypothetical protein
VIISTHSEATVASIVLKAMRRVSADTACTVLEIDRDECHALVAHIDSLSSSSRAQAKASAPLARPGFLTFWRPISEGVDDNTTVLIALTTGDVTTGYREDGNWYTEAGDILAYVYAWAHVPGAPAAEALK